jgi:hypothetical protein
LSDVNRDRRAGQIGARRRVLALCAPLLGLGLVAPVPGRAQDAAGLLLATTCIEGVSRAGFGDAARIQGCEWGALTAHALQSGLGTLMASGGVIPSSPSTAGTRFGGSPRWILDGGVGGAVFRHPDLSQGATPTSSSVRRAVAAPRVTVVRGVFDGLSLAPGVGGIGAVDVVADVRALPVPGLDGDEARTYAFGGGARLGVLRESFILPGITLSAMYRQGGRMAYGVPSAERPRVEVAPKVASVGAMVGKDLLFVGVSAGVQRDWIQGDARVAVAGASSDPDGLVWSQGTELNIERTTWVVGANWTFIIAQFAVQLGWAGAPDAPLGPDALANLKSGDGGLVGSMSFRITY